MRYTLSVNYSGTDEGGSEDFDRLGEVLEALEVQLSHRHERLHKQVVLMRHYSGYDMLVLAETVPALWVIDQVEG